MDISSSNIDVYSRVTRLVVIVMVVMAASLVNVYSCHLLFLSAGMAMMLIVRMRTPLLRSVLMLALGFLGFTAVALAAIIRILFLSLGLSIRNILVMIRIRKKVQFAASIEF